MSNQLTAVGTIIKPKHLQGAVLLQLSDAMLDYLSDNPEPTYLFVQLKRPQRQSPPQPYFIQKWERGNEIVLKLEESNSRTDAENLRSATLFLETDKIQIYLDNETAREWDFLLGYTIIDTDDTHIGTISDLFYLPANTLAQVIIEGKEVLIPLHENLVELVDEAQKIIVIDLPEGLVALYLGENEADT